MAALVDAIGPGPAVTAAEIAGALTMTNRLMDATGSRVPKRALDIALPVLKQIGAMDFPNADLVADQQSTVERKLRRLARRLRR
jgi:hypothetical protein